MSLTIRDRQPELMDQPGLDEQEHRQALRGLARINKISGSDRILWPAIRELARELSREIRVLDLACGGGDVTRGIERRARNAGIPIAVHGADLSSTAVAQCNQAAEMAGLKNMRFFELDLLKDELPTDYDVMYSSLFLHHLDEEDAQLFLRKQREATRHLVLVNDLKRSRWGYTVAWVGCRLLTRSYIVHTDGPLSVRAAFTTQEMRSLAESAGLENPSFTSHWPARYVMKWRKGESS